MAKKRADSDSNDSLQNTSSSAGSTGFTSSDI